MANDGSGGENASEEVPEGLEQALTQFLTTGKSANDSNPQRGRYEAVVGVVQEVLAEQAGGHNEIDTRSGEKITPLAPQPEKIKLEDIAHGLSNVGRFAGQGKEFYSVARHSVHVSLEVAAREGSQGAQRYALIHDAAEAYLSDVPGPVKKSLPGYKHAERRLDAAVVAAIGLEVKPEERELVEEADTDVGKHELSVQFPDGDHDEVDLEHDPGTGDAANEGKELFLNRAEDLNLR